MNYFRKRSRRSNPNTLRRKARRLDFKVDSIAPRPETLAKYGITAEQYESMYLAQHGGCAICGRPPGSRRLAVDHCHRNPLKIRGLLCASHNYALGMFKDNVEHMQKAVDYLRRDPPILLEKAGKARRKHQRVWVSKENVAEGGCGVREHADPVEFQEFLQSIPENKDGAWWYLEQLE